MIPADHVKRKTPARESLLDASEELFVSKGYSAVGTREIADAAGVNLAAIQYHFGSKAKLFAECLRRMMARTKADNPFGALTAPVSTADEAASILVRFIYRFLDGICHPKGPEVCRIIFREIFSETSNDPEMSEALISSVVEEYHRPSDELLLGVVRKVAPELSEAEVALFAHSIIGQCSFYVTHRPFIERLRGMSFSEVPQFERVVRHIATFSLTALGLTKDAVETAVESGFAAERSESACPRCKGHQSIKVGEEER